MSVELLIELGGAATARSIDDTSGMIESARTDSAYAARGYSIVVMHQLPKLARGVRFPLPAPIQPLVVRIANGEASFRTRVLIKTHYWTE